MVQKKRKSNPVTNAAQEAAKSYIVGYEQATDTFNEIASEQLRERDPRTINTLRENRRNIRSAREELNIED